MVASIFVRAIVAGVICLPIGVLVAEQAAARDLKFSVQSGPGNINYDQAAMMAEEVKKATEGDISIQLYPNAQLGSEGDEVQGLLLETVDIAKPSAGVAANWIPELNVINLPFVFRDLDHFEKVWSGPFGDLIADVSAKKGLHFFCGYMNGTRHFLSKKPIFSIEDMKGIKIRAIPNPIYVATFNAMGANAVTIDYTELYGALQQGVVDAADAAANNALEGKFYEVAPYWSMVGWSLLSNVMLMSESVYQSLPPNEQEIMTKAAKAACQYQNDYFRSHETDQLQQLLERGEKVTVPWQKPFLEAVQPVYDEFLKTDADKAAMKLVQDTK